MSKTKECCNLCDGHVMVDIHKHSWYDYEFSCHDCRNEHYEERKIKDEVKQRYKKSNRLMNL